MRGDGILETQSIPFSVAVLEEFIKHPVWKLVVADWTDRLSMIQDELAMAPKESIYQTGENSQLERVAKGVEVLQGELTELRRMIEYPMYLIQIKKVELFETSGGQDARTD